MSSLAYFDSYLRDILKQTKVIALVGASNNPERPSYEIMDFLLQHKYTVIPVNPGLAGTTLMGQHVFSSLSEIHKPIDLVNIFLNSARINPVVDEILHFQTLPKTIWMQLGIRDDLAAKRAEAKGIKVVMDLCIKTTLQRLNNSKDDI